MITVKGFVCKHLDYIIPVEGRSN